MLELYEALVAQSVERQAVNLQVDCSNQSWGEFFLINQIIIFFLKYKFKKKFNGRIILK